MLFPNIAKRSSVGISTFDDHSFRGTVARPKLPDHDFQGAKHVPVMVFLVVACIYLMWISVISSVDCQMYPESQSSSHHGRFRPEYLSLTPPGCSELTLLEENSRRAFCLTLTGSDVIIDQRLMNSVNPHPRVCKFNVRSPLRNHCYLNSS